jgi:hypothetical protein
VPSRRALADFFDERFCGPACPLLMSRAPLSASTRAGNEMHNHNRFPSSKLKLDEFFLNWLSSADSQKLVRSPPRPQSCLTYWLSLSFQNPFQWRDPIPQPPFLTLAASHGARPGFSTAPLSGTRTCSVVLSTRSVSPWCGGAPRQAWEGVASIILTKIS